MGDHIHVGLIDFTVVGAYILIWHYLFRTVAYAAKRSGKTSLSGAIGSLI